MKQICIQNQAELSSSCRSTTRQEFGLLDLLADSYDRKLVVTFCVWRPSEIIYV
jgi:hypothetical protein